MIRSLFPILMLNLICFAAKAQTEQVFDVSMEIQAYPTGIIPGLRLEKGFAEKHAVHLRLGYNWVRHRDLGEHDDERGDGYGFTLGYKYYFGSDFQRFFLGARNDIWWNTIDWKDNIDTPMEVSGQTDITVVQPTLEAGYLFAFGENWLFTPAIGFGYEVNVKTEGQPTGEGAILLLGISLGRRF